MSDATLISAKKVPCPQCGELVVYHASNPFRPFCCKRCKLIDLGAWADDSYVIAGATPDPLMLDGDRNELPAAVGKNLQ